MRQRDRNEKEVEGGVLTLIEERRVAPPAVNTGDVSRHMSPALPVAYGGGGLEP